MVGLFLADRAAAVLFEPTVDAGRVIKMAAAQKTNLVALVELTQAYSAR